MAFILRNENLEVHVDHPTEHYNLPRFDWTGKIVEVKFKNTLLSGVEIATLNKGQFCGKGFYNEFGIDSPLGYHQAAIGGWFHKIGVGLLKKDQDPYHFHKIYEVRPNVFEVAVAPDKIRFKCHSPLINGYSYLLDKEIELFEDGFEINYRLVNNGEKTIATNEYNHNFLSINQDLIGRDYLFKFPFHIRAELFGESVNPEQIVEIGQSDIQFNGTPKEQFFFSNLSGGKMVDARWALENIKSKIGISESGNFQTDMVNLWGWSHVISPELFINLKVEPGQSMAWTRTYHVYEVG